MVRNQADYWRARSLASQWLERVYGRWLDEWFYRHANRSILVEPFVGTDDALPVDYELFVFGGRAVMVQVHDGRGQDHRWRQYDRNWAPLSRNAIPCAAPAGLNAMLDAAERLARGHDFLRVDFYEVGGQPLFGAVLPLPRIRTRSVRSA